MPPTNKPVAKGKGGGESKAKKAAVAAALALALAAALAHAQTTTAANATGNAAAVVGQVESWTVGGLGLVVDIFGIMFWAAVGIAIFHIAVAYIAPTRFQRLGSMWDAVERTKDIAIGLAVLFFIFYGIMAAAASISGSFNAGTAWTLFAKVVSKPLVDLFNAVMKAI
ncbi:MAG: hypothetical protein RQ839_09795 [Thermoproteus sp.]|nr:hypothetical protein [Thermoproteus sp.]